MQDGSPPDSTPYGVSGEQGVECFTLQDIVCGGEGSFHLVVYNTVVGQRAVFAFQMIAPAFLPEDFVVFVNVRVEYGVHVDMHQVLEVGIVGAGYRYMVLSG